MVWAGILGTVAQLGLPQALAYSAARDSDSIGSIFATTIVIWIAQSIGILVVGHFAAGELLARYQPAAVRAVQVYLFSIPFSLLITYLSTMAQGLKRFGLFNTLRIVSAAAIALCLALAAVLDIRQVARVVVLLLGSHVVIALAGLAWFLVRIHPTGHFEAQCARRLLSYGLKSYWGSLSWMANARLDQFIMGAFVGLDAVGYYAVAVSYATVLFPLSGAFAMVLFPNIAAGDPHEARNQIMLTLKMNLVMSGVGALVLTLLSPIAVPMLFGADFRPSIRPAIVLLVGTILLGCNYVLSDGLRGLGQPLVPSIGEVIGVGITVAGLLLFLPRFGIQGAAWVSVIAYGTVSLVLLTAMGRILGGIGI